MKKKSKTKTLAQQETAKKAQHTQIMKLYHHFLSVIMNYGNTSHYSLSDLQPLAMVVGGLASRIYWMRENEFGKARSRTLTSQVHI